MLLTNQNAEIVACTLLGLKSYAYSNFKIVRERARVRFDQTKIARPEVQLSLY